MTLLEVAKHALEAMEDAMYRADTHEFYDAKESLRYAIEQAEQAEQQPVAHSVVERLRPDEYQCRVSVKWVGQPVSGPLYTAPTPRKPLTDEEIDRVIEGWWRDDLKMKYEELARAIERAHGIGEQT